MVKNIEFWLRPMAAGLIPAMEGLLRLCMFSHFYFQPSDIQQNKQHLSIKNIGE